MSTTAFYKQKILAKTDPSKQYRELSAEEISRAARSVAVDLSSKKSNPAAVHNENNWWKAIAQLNSKVQS